MKTTKKQLEALITEAVEKAITNVTLKEMPIRRHVSVDPDEQLIIDGAKERLTRFHKMEDFKNALKDSKKFHADWQYRYSIGIVNTLSDFGISVDRCRFKIGEKDDEVYVKLPNETVAMNFANSINSRLRSTNLDSDSMFTWPNEVWYPGHGYVVVFWYD